MMRSSVATESFDSTTTVELGDPFTQLNPGTSSISKANGRCFCDDIANGAASHSATLANDQYASLKISVLVHINDPNCYTGVIARASADLNAARDYYFCVVGAQQSGGNWTVTLGKYVNGALTTLNSESVPFVVNDRIEIECEGTTIRGMINGVLINSNFSVTDSSLSSGNAGVTGRENSGPGVVEGDDLDIGDLVVPPATGVGSMLAMFQ